MYNPLKTYANSFMTRVNGSILGFFSEFKYFLTSFFNILIINGQI